MMKVVCYTFSSHTGNVHVVYSDQRSKGQNFRNTKKWNRGNDLIGQLSLSTISNLELTDPLCEMENRGLTLVRLILL